MSERPWPPTDRVAEILEGPWRFGSEQRWSVRLDDGGRGMLAQLLPELRRDEAVRRRYVGDLARAASSQVPGVARLLSRSPDHDDEPWRLREDPDGEPLDTWLETHAPAPIDVVAELGAALADILHALHQRGVVVRDLQPRAITVTPSGPVLTDVGLARVDLLSTRTAASLVLEGTPYASPEQLRKTVIDQRSDLYGLGVILWEALTGTRPHGDDIALLADPATRPSLVSLRDAVPAAMQRCLERCVDLDPEGRPETAAQVASVLRGEASSFAGIAKVACQSCGASLLQGQRLCLACGKEAVVFAGGSVPQGEGYRVVLRSVSEDVGTQEALRAKLEPLSRNRLPDLDFIHGDARMYSKEERKRKIALPQSLFGGLTQEAAEQLRTHLAVSGVKVAVRTARPNLLWLYGLIASVAVFFAVLGTVAALPWIVVAPIVAVLAVLGAVVVPKVASRQVKPALFELRSGPAALPASDPLVARLATLSQGEIAADVRERLGHLALSVQRLVDHRAALPEVERKEVDVVTEPIASLVDLIEAEVQRVTQIDAALAELDEGALVRALTSAQATGGDEEALLDALHRLRDLEQSRAAAMHRLLEATTLSRRAADLGLQVQDDAGQHERDVKRALAALGGV